METIYVKNLYHGTIFHLSSLTTAGSGHGHHHYLEQKRFCCCSCRRSPVPSTIRTFSLWLSILAENEAGTWCLGTWRPPSPVISYTRSSAQPDDEHAPRHAIRSSDAPCPWYAVAECLSARRIPKHSANAQRHRSSTQGRRRSTTEDFLLLYLQQGFRATQRSCTAWYVSLTSYLCVIDQVAN